MSKPINNYIGYVLASRKMESKDDTNSNVVNARRPTGAWQVDEPFSVYPTLDDLIFATPDFDPRTCRVLEVTVHILGEDVKKVTV